MTMKLKKKAANTIGAFLGSDSEFEGRLAFQGTIRIDGSYKGNIKVDGTLIVGPSGRVQADINASNVIVNGEVIGNLNAETVIEVHASGQVYGNLSAPKVTIHEGAVFQGQCQSGEKRTALQNGRPVLHPVVKKSPPAENKEPGNRITRSA